jgi:hypothetical protein
MLLARLLLDGWRRHQAGADAPANAPVSAADEPKTDQGPPPPD